MSFPGRTYYGSSLEDPRQQSELWSNTPTRQFNRNQHPNRNMFLFGLGIAGVGIAGKISIGNNRVWDYYIKGIRAAEEYSPGNILRTFQLSNFFSQYETSTRNLHIKPELLRGNPILAQYYHNLLGGGVAKERLLREGVNLHNGRLYWGSSNQVALKYARGIRTPPGATSWIGKAWASKNGITPEMQNNWQSFITKEQPNIWQPELRNLMSGGMGTQIIGSQSRVGLYGQHINALMTEWTGRFNRLLQKPAELPIVSTAFHGLQKVTKKYLGKELDFSVKSGTGFEMMARLMGKYGLVLPAAYMGYKTLDWTANDSRLTRGTVFEEGITIGLATMGAKAHIATSRLAEIAGLHKYREKQEKIAPGSTSLTKLLAFPIIGSLTAEGSLWAVKSGRMLREQYRHPELESWQARQIVEEGMKNFGGKGVIARTAKYFARSDGLFSRPGRLGNIWRRLAEKTGADTELSFKLLGKMTPAKFAGTAGMLVGVVAVLPFIPGALIPGKRPEELKAEYSGQKEVAIRQGRFWEAGRSFWEGNRPSYFAPNWYARMRMNAREISIWGEDAKKKLPIRRWFEQEFTYNLERKHYKDRPYPMCFHPDTPTYTSKGFKAIKDIEEGDLVLNKNGEWTPVLFKTNRPCTEKQLVEITIAADNRKLLVTPDHKVLCLKNNLTYKKRGDRCRGKIKVISNGHLEWMSAKDISRHDFVVIPVQNKNVVQNPILDLALLTGRAHTDNHIVYDTRASQDLLDAFYSPLSCKEAYKFYKVNYKVLHALRTNGGYKHLISRYLEIDEDMAYLLGLWLAEGWTIDKQVGFAFHLNERETYAADVLKIVAAKFQANGKISIQSEQGIQLTISSKILQEILESLFGKNKANYKTFDLDFLKWPIKLKQALAKGLIRGDGSTIKKNEVTFRSASSSLANQLRLLLLSLNIPVSFKKIVPSSLWKKSIIKDREIKKNLSYTLSISGSGFETFSSFEEEVQYQKTTGDRKGLIYQGNFYLPVRQVQTIEYEGDVYDITVENEQSFLTTCIVHNSALPFQDVPFLGPVLANTIGRLIKPPRLMHSDEFLAGDKFRSQPSRYGERIATEMGEQLPGKPISPYDPRATIGEEWMRTYEMAGLPGFVASSIKNQLTGSGDVFDQMSQMESFRRVTSIERPYYESELGGMFGFSEAWRRLYPHRNRGIPLWNPIKNNAASWLPGEGEKSPDFQHSDPFTKIPMGELRLPGVGYTQRFPELAGISPEDYPLMHKWKILADVAPYSDAYGKITSEVRRARKSGDWTDENEQIYQTGIEQLKARKQKKVFQEYKYLSSTGNLIHPAQKIAAEDSTDLIGTLNRIKSEQQEKPSIAQKLFGGYWELLAHNAETAMDQLTPMSPGAKLVHQRTAIEDYERTNLYGQNAAFWSSPIRDFLRPTVALAAEDLGYRGVPPHERHKRNLEAYFDILKYVKNTRLANIARASNDYDAARQFEAKKDQTLFGINPYTMNYTSIFNALPRRERDYFNAFTAADTSEERQRILEMVPENEKALYAARWRLTFADEVKKATKAGKLTSAQTDEAENILAHIHADAQSEGMPNDKDLQAEYIKTRQKGESYGDWYRRTHLLTQLKSLPGPDFVGFCPSVDLDDVKLRVIQNEGESMHEYDLWDSRAQTLANKPYINDQSIAPVTNPEKLSQSEMHDRIDALLSQNNLKGDTFVRGTPGPNTRIDVDVTNSSKEEELNIQRTIG